MQSLVSILLKKDERLIDRDLSWLQFNERVIQEAQDESNPLLERLRFVGISSGNLDEFFMIRFAGRIREIASLTRQSEKYPERLERVLQIRKEILQAANRLQRRSAQVFWDLQQRLRQQRVHIVREMPRSQRELEHARKVFQEQLFPEVPQPEFLSDESLQAIKNLQQAYLFSNGLMIGLPKRVPSVYFDCDIKDKAVCYFTQDLIAWFLAPMLGLPTAPAAIRLTRDADVQVELEANDPEAIPDIVRKRVDSRERRAAVRLQVNAGIDPALLQRLSDSYKLSSEQVFHYEHPLHLSAILDFVSAAQEQKAFAKLYFPKFESCLPSPFDCVGKIFKGISQRDYLFHHPYDAFEGYVNFIREAVEDPAVESIQQTVYRVDTLSKVTELLCAAATAGKRVRVVIEPRARFDEMHNVQLAEQFTKAGAEVVFSVGPLKMHAKITCVTRRCPESQKQEVYTHLSTGNYNAKTARQYTDLALFTANPKFGADALSFFESMGEGEFPQGMRSLVLAPTGLHRRVVSLIRNEIKVAQSGKPARIFAKVNALVDPKIIEALYAASQAGVHIDLMVRGACSLLPGVPGLSERIKVFSVLDRFLEHSRIYYFESQQRVYLSSADWMPRNFFSRFEIAFPVQDPRLLSYISTVIIPTYMQDRAKSRVLTSQGVWRKRGSARSDGPRAQFIFKDLAKANYRNTPLDDDQ